MNPHFLMCTSNHNTHGAMGDRSESHGRNSERCLHRIAAADVLPMFCLPAALACAAAVHLASGTPQYYHGAASRALASPGLDRCQHPGAAASSPPTSARDGCRGGLDAAIWPSVSQFSCGHRSGKAERPMHEKTGSRVNAGYICFVFNNNTHQHRPQPKPPPPPPPPPSSAPSAAKSEAVVVGISRCCSAPAAVALPAPAPAPACADRVASLFLPSPSPSLACCCQPACSETTLSVTRNVSLDLSNFALTSCVSTTACILYCMHGIAL
jgi:hypothetical protein